MSAVLAVGVLPGLDGSAVAQTSAPARTTAESTTADSSSSLTEEDALAKAKRTGKAVEITSKRTESSDVFATPDGNLEAREYLRPVRARVKGEWRPLDTDLVKTPEGMVAPKVATVDLAFSGGGESPLVRMERAGRELALTWPGRLPAPQLAGDTATYREVLPGVDLRMGAREDGFTQLLVVKSAEAAASAELAELRLRLAAEGMEVRETAGGGLEAVDEGAKNAVFEAPTPLMWDSSGGDEEPEAEAAERAKVGSLAAGSDADAADPGDDRARGEPGAGESGKLAPVDVDVPENGNELVLTPDAEVLRGKDTEYPVFIDPQWYSPRATAWTMASKHWPTSPQWKFNGDPDAGMGYCGWAYCKPQDTKRLFYRIPVSKFKGKSILSAEFVVRNVHSASCNKRGVQLWRTKGISKSTTWNTQKRSGFWVKRLASKSFAHGYTGCAAKDAEFNVKSAVKEAAGKKWSTLTFGLRASSESDRYGWKRFSKKAHLRVKYNRAPRQIKMSQLAMEYGGVCKKPGSKARVRTLGKIYANRVTDPDRDRVSVQFQAKWDAGDGKGTVVRWKPSRTSSKKSGSSFAVKLPKSIPRNKTVHWYARSYDGAQYSPWSYAGSPTGCYFVYDTSVPKAPAISSGEYPASDPENPDDPWFDGVGQYGSFTLDSASSDVNRYRYGYNGDPLPKNQLSTSSGAARTAKVLPDSPGLNFVTAQAFDKAGNGSEIRTYQFRVKAGQPERATWQLDEDVGAEAAKGSTPPRTATLHGGASPGAPGVQGTGLSLNGTDGYASAEIPVVDTDRGHTVSVWVKLPEIPTSGSPVAVSFPGNVRSSNALYYSPALGRWVFNHRESDTADATIVRAMAGKPGGVAAGEWTHLVGSYDGVNKRISLFVNGELAGQAGISRAWDARRGLMIGASTRNGAPNSFFPGVIDELQIFDKRIAQDEVDKLYAKERIGDPGRPAVAVFDLDEEEDATEVNGRGDVLPARFHGGVTPGVPGVAGQAAEFNGTDGYAKIGRTSGPHVNTFRSFTVSAWVKLDHKPDRAAIITAQAGRERPGFELYYSAHFDRWVFNQYASDDPDAKIIRAMPDKPGGVRPGEWTHLAGVHDTVADTLTLYLNGRKAGSVKLGGAFYADQSMLIGAGSYSGQVKNYFPGTIDDVRLFDRPVAAGEVRQLFTQRPLVKGRWMFEEAEDEPSSTPDASAEGNAMSLHGDARIGPGWVDSGALELDGVNSYAATGHVPVDTSASFTVTAWAQAAATPEGGTALISAAGSRQSAFSVRYVPDAESEDSPGRWQLAMPDQDTDGAAVTRVDNQQFFDVRDWNHLALVYDGFARQARLYVNGELEEVACADGDEDGEADDSTCTDRLSWTEDLLTFKATGSLQIGRARTAGSWGEYWPGSVDDVWTFQGALTDPQIAALARGIPGTETGVPGGD